LGDRRIRPGDPLVSDAVGNHRAQQSVPTDGRTDELSTELRPCDHAIAAIYQGRAVGFAQQEASRGALAAAKTGTATD
jgi:hypothetical protein